MAEHKCCCCELDAEKVKKLDAIIYDKSEKEIVNSFNFEIKDTTELFLDYNVIEEKQNNISNFNRRLIRGRNSRLVKKKL